MRVRGRVQRLSLLARFSVLCLVALLALALGLAWGVNRAVEQRALSNAEQTARIVASSLAPRIERPALERGFGPRQLAALDRAVPSTGVRRVKVYNGDGRLMYSDDRSRIGEVPGEGATIWQALEGRLVSGVERGLDHSGDGDAVLETYVPLLDDGHVIGAIEVYLPHGHVLSGVEADKQKLNALLASAFVLLYLLLLRVVARASRTLRQQAEENRRMAHQDPLTGLGNRRALEQAVEGAIEHADSGRCLALLVIDLDHFKEVNDTLGHHQGDLLLAQVAERLSSTLRENDCLARLGGDEFGVVLRGLPDSNAYAEVAVRLREALERPYHVSGLTIPVEASIGIAVHPQHGGDFTELMRHADVAMYEAKGTNSGVVTYSDEIDNYTEDRLALAGELRQALAEGQILPFYQPLVSSRDRRIVAVEALARWQHPERGLLLPADFLPLAERTGDIGPLTVHMLDATLRQLREWLDRGLELSLFVNLAASNASDHTLPDVVARLLEEHGVAPRRLTLEISERTAMTDAERVPQVLARLDAMGVRLALDDFGAGASSLAHLRRLRLDELKIDRSLVLGMSTSDDDAMIVRSTVELAHSLGLTCVAEGVEDARTARALDRLGCEKLQGFHFSHPLPAEAVEARVRERAASAA